MPRKQADYPEWVLKYKKKGTYINRAGDKYYLYATHSLMPLCFSASTGDLLSRFISLTVI